MDYSTPMIIKLRLVFLGILLIAAAQDVQAQDCTLSFSNNGIEQTIDCNDPIPSFENCTLNNGCCDNVSIDTFESQSAPANATCVLSTAFGPGQDWAFWLPGVHPNSVVWVFTEGGTYEEYADGTARIEGVITSAANSSWQFHAILWMHSARNWTEWSALGRGYKDDLNLAGSTYQDWTYYELADGFSRLEGMNALEGSQLLLRHHPSTLYFGFQSGMAANNKNANEGLSGWFTYDGYVNGIFMEGHGDINVDKSCITTTTGCANATYTRICKAEQSCGLAAFSTQTIQVVDTTAPVVVDLISPYTVPCDNTSGIYINVDDDCSSVNITYSDEVIEPGCSGSVQRTYTISDYCGNTTTAIQILEFSGGVPEFTSFPEDGSIECSNFQGPEGLVTHTDGCSNTTLTITEDILVGTCANTFTAAYTYTLTDDCGNSVSQVWTVSVFDNTPPNLFGVPENATLECGSDIGDALVFAIDNCVGEVSVGVSASTIPNECGYTFIRTWTAIDACGNETSASQTITFVDTTAPSFDFVPENINAECGFEWTDVLATATDDCSAVTVTFIDTELDTDCGQNILRTFTATDACGNSVEATQLISLSDNTAPILIGVPEYIELGCNGVLEVVVVTATDNCDQNVEVILTTETITDDCSIAVYRTWTAIDACGNETVATQLTEIFDNDEPEFIFLPENLELNCGDDIPVIFPVAEDECSEVTITFFDQEPFDCAGSFIRVWSATDACGNSDAFDQIIHFTDNSDPYIISFPENITIQCGEVPTLSEVDYAFGDDCGDVSVTVFEDYFEGECPGSYQIIYTFVVDDPCGNRITPAWVVTVNDTEAPVFDEMSSMVLECGDDIPAIEEPTVNDNCSETVFLTMAENIENNDCSYVLTRTWTATDLCGNSSTADQMYSFEDNTDPTFLSLPENITIQCGDDVPTIIPPVAIDACVGEVPTEVTFIETPGSCAGTYQLLYIFRAYDNCGNQAVAIQEINVVDTTAPSFEGSSSVMMLPCDNYQGVFVTVSDNCDDDVNLSYSDEIINSFCGGMVIRTYTATDLCGNVSTFEQTILLEDEEAPQFTSFPQNVSVDCDNIPSISAGLITFTDNCSAAEMTVDEIIFEGSCPQSFTLARVVTITDGCGNSTSQIWEIQVSDNEAPQLFGVPADLTIECGDIIPDAFVFAQDNCAGIVDVGVSANTEVVGCTTLFTRTWFTMDACGNFAQQSQVITSIDTTPPTLSSYPEDVTLSCDSPLPPLPFITATDNCGGSIDVDFQEVFNGGSCGTVEREWCASDCSGNLICWTQTITYIAEFQPDFYTSWNSPAELRITLAMPETAQTIVELFNPAGQRMAVPMERVVNAEETIQVPLNTAPLAPGVYVLRAVQGEQSWTTKFVISE